MPHNVQVFDPNGTLSYEFSTVVERRQLDSDNRTGYVGLAAAERIAVTPDGLVAVSDLHRTGVFYPDGTFAFYLSGHEGPTPPEIPPIINDMAAGPNGTFAVVHREIAHSGARYVQVFGPDGAFAFRLGPHGHGDGELVSPRAVAFGPGGLIAVVDLTDRVQLFYPNGTLAYVLRSDLHSLRADGGTAGRAQGIPAAPGQPSPPHADLLIISTAGESRIGIAFGPLGEFVIADERNRSLRHIFHPNGTVAAKLVYDAAHNTISDVAIGPTGTIVAADMARHRIVLFNGLYPQGALGPPPPVVIEPAPIGPGETPGGPPAPIGPGEAPGGPPVVIEQQPPPPPPADPQERQQQQQEPPLPPADPQERPPSGPPAPIEPPQRQPTPTPTPTPTASAPLSTALIESAVFTARNTVAISYSDALGPPAGHGNRPVYASVAVDGGAGGAGVARPVLDVAGLGTAVHTIAFGGAGVGRNQTGTVTLAVNLTGIGGDGGDAPPGLAAGPIPVAAGMTVHTAMLPPHPQQPHRAVPIEPEGFTRAVNATAAGDAARPAINVTGLAVKAAPGSALPGALSFPAEPVVLAARFASAEFPPNATARPVPPGGVLFLRALDAETGPSLDGVAADLGYAGAGGLELRTIVEAGGGRAAITFDKPVRILLEGQSGGRAFYVNGSADGAAGAAAEPIDAACAADSAGAVHEQLGGAGECHMDLPGGAGAGKVIYAYRLLPVGTVHGGHGDPPPPPPPPEPASVRVLQRAGGSPLQSPVSYTAGQAIAVAVRFTAPVEADTAGGAPYLELRTGSAGARAAYASGSGTDVLEFAYAVRGGDLAGRLSYAGAGALALGGGAITAAGSGAPASVELPRPGEPGSLSHAGAPAVRIDAEPGRPVLDVGILDEAGPGGGVSAAALAAAEQFNERQGREPGALVINATAYGALAPAPALRAAHSSGAGPSVYVGPSTDRGLHAAMPYAAANGIVLVSAGSTAPSLAVEGDRTFRLLPGDGIEAGALARLAQRAGAGSVHAVLENATYGPSGGLEVPPPPGRFSHGFAAALAGSAVPPLSGTVVLEGAAGERGAAAAAASALDASVRSARAPAAVVYMGSPEGLAALAGSAAGYPSLASASWIASGMSAGSLLLAGDGEAALFAAQAGLSAARWSPPEGDAARGIDTLLPAGAGAGSRHGAYAAHDAVLVIGAAADAAAAAGDRRIGDDADAAAAAVADGLHAAAAAHVGALGDIALDSAGDLWVPALYDVWTVETAGEGGAEWSRQQGALDEERACSISLARAKIDYGAIDPGQTSRPHLQTIVNTGQLPFAQVELAATPWHVDAPGGCAPGSGSSLPAGMSEIRTDPGGEFADLDPSGIAVARGLEAGGQAPIWYRLSLAGYADLPHAEITQCVTYEVRCG